MRTILIVGFTLVALTGFGLWRLADHDLDRRTNERLTFTVSGNTLSGTIWLPDKSPIAVVALVHGDGAQDRTSAGGLLR